MTYHAIGAAGSRDDVELGDLETCNGVRTGADCASSSGPCACLNMSDEATSLEVKGLVGHVTKASMSDGRLWDQGDENALVLAMTEIPGPGLEDLLQKTGSSWLYPSSRGVFYLYRRACQGDDFSQPPAPGCSARFPLVTGVVGRRNASPGLEIGVFPPPFGAHGGAAPPAEDELELPEERGPTLARVATGAALTAGILGLVWVWSKKRRKLRG